MSIDFDRLRETFFEEAHELMSDMESAFLALEAAPDDRATIDRIFRAAHSIKGGSGTFGFEEVTRTAHALESLLDPMRSGTLRAAREHIDAMLSARDLLGELLAARQRGNTSTTDIAPTLARLRHLLDARLLASRAVYRLHVRPVGAGSREPLEVLAELADLGALRQATVDHRAVPPLGQLDPEALHLTFDLVLETDVGEARLRAALAAIEGDVEIELMGSAPASPAVTAAAPTTATAATTAAVPATKTAAAAPADSPEPPARTATVESSSIRVPVEKLDSLMNLVGELVIAQSMIADVMVDFTPAKLALLHTAAVELERHTRELQERVMSIRMVPVSTVFHRFPRLVRDVAASCGKSVVLELQGEQTELDKSVVERIVDPLTHLVRNCIDHGLETPEVRQRSGKPAQGTVKLEAHHSSGNVFIQISDDGRGLDTARILAKAVERGLVPRGTELSEDQIHALIFAPGFSTAEQVSDLSGRGVGMDVVKRSVESMGGVVTIATRPGHGTTFTIRLPLTLAILDGQYFALGDRTFVVPLISIRESLKLTARDVKRVLGRGELAMVRGEAIPLVRLRAVFGIGGPPPPPDPLVVVVAIEGALMALEVDALLAQSQVVIKNIETHYRQIDGIMGATIMGNGQIAMILDVQGIHRMNLDAKAA